MRQTAIRISDSYIVPELQLEAWSKASHRFGDAQVSPDEVGGYFDFTDWRGKDVSRQNFLGRWTLLYFGYSRCRGSCREAAPLITRAAEELRGRGVAARAAFVDIETQPMGKARMNTGPAGTHRHGANWPMRFAMSQLYLDHAGKLEVMTGNRGQLAQATAAFHILREHVPPRPGEEMASINHSSMIFLVGPDTLVAGYGYHDMGASALVRLVEQLDKAERREIDFAAVRRRYIRGACGGDLPA